ncbi:riboflavin synthase domain-like protein [Biscogniauxia marginata]|nr:riboflavin synthase domain-like protein [Biscogniauxia marginata]
MSLEHNYIQGNKDDGLDNRQILILYGSETGNGQDAAGDLGRLTERLRFRTLVCEMNDVELSTLLRYPFVVFVISTTGQGEIPRNARTFWKSLLRKRLPPSCLRSVKFTTFGLGDSSYSKFNWAARKLHKRLEQLGAVEFFPRGEADERHEDGIDGAFLPWSVSLRTHLQADFPLPEGLSPIPPDVPLPPMYTIELLPQMDSTDVTMPDRDDVLEGGGQHNNQQQPLDDTAALFSHVDTLHPEVLQQTLQVERMSVHSPALSARLSERTANEIVGGINILDRPNMLRDHPAKYSLQDTDNTGDTPPDNLLPIPKAWRASVEKNDRVTPPDHWQDVRHLTLRVYPKFVPPNPKSVVLAYVPGDVVVLYPKNFPSDVQTLIDLMGWGAVADRPFEHRSKDYNGIPSRPKNCHPLPRSTLRDLLLHNYDITSIPKRSFFEAIAFYTKDPTHQERLKEFANPGFSDEFYDYTSRPRRSILEVLQDFPSVQIPYEHVPSLFPVMRGREYSIASGGVLEKDPISPNIMRVELLIALVKYKTVLRKTRQGLCSRYLSSLRPGTIIHIGIKEQENLDFSLHQRPLLAIGPGTGIAPIRSLIWDRHEIPECGDTVLFFGGRNRDADYYFKEEWEEMGLQVFTAFSRDQREKIYVQDRIREQAALVCSLLDKGAVVYLCGSSGKMPEAVRQALYDAMVIGGMAPDPETAKQMFHSWACIREEVW